MNISTQLESLQRDCAWVKSPVAMAVTFPTLLGELDALTRVSTNGAGASLPVACAGALIGPVAQVLCAAGDMQAGRSSGKRFDELDDAEVRQDPLVLIMAHLFEQSAISGLRVQPIPAMVAAWLSARICEGRRVGLPKLSDADAERAGELARWLRGLRSEERGKAMGRLAWEVSGRVGAALAIAVEAGHEIDGGGVLRALISNRLAFVYSRGTLDRDLRLDEAANVLSTDIDAGLAAAAVASTSAVLSAVEQRVRSGKATGLDLAVRANLNDTVEPMEALLDPVMGTVILGSLAALVKSADLREAGMDAATARAMLRPAAHRALAACWNDFAAPLREWDAISTLCARFECFSGETSERQRSAHTGGVPLVVPRPTLRRLSSSTVVAVRLGPLRVALEEQTRTREGPGFEGGLRRRWTELVAAFRVQAQSICIDHGICVFESSYEAVRFAIEAATQLAGPFEVDLGPSGMSAAVPGGVRVSIGMAAGHVDGGSAGGAADLRGPVVSRAINYAGVGSLGGSSSDPTGMRRVAFGPRGIQSDGVLADAEVGTEVLSHLRSIGAAVHLAGESTPVAGVSSDFASAPVRGWWDTGERGVVAVVGMTDSVDDPVELLCLDRFGLKAFSDADARFAATQTGRRETPDARRVETDTAEFDPFSTEETQTFERVQPETEPESAAISPETYQGLEPSDSFLGFAGAGGPAKKPASAGKAAAESILAGETAYSEPDEDSLTPAPEPAEPTTHAPAPAPLLMLDSDQPTSDISVEPIVEVEDPEEGASEPALEPATSNFGFAQQADRAEEGGGASPRTENLVELEPTASFMGFQSGDVEAPAGASVAETVDAMMQSQGQTLIEADGAIQASDAVAEPGPIGALMRALAGYVVVMDSERFLFGRVDGSTLADATIAVTEGDEFEAYCQFLREKSAAGFVANDDARAPLPRGAVPSPLNVELLMEAYAEVAP